MNSSVEKENRLCLALRSVILQFIGALSETVFTKRNEVTDLDNMELYFKKKNPRDIMRKVVEKVLPFKSEIEARNQNFFIEHPELFDGLGDAEKVKYYSEAILNDKRIDDDDRATAWKYMDRIVEAAEKYKKIK